MKKLLKHYKKFILVFVIIIFCYIVYNKIKFNKFIDYNKKQKKSELINITKNSALLIDIELKKIVAVANKVADSLNENLPNNYSEIENKLTTILSENENMYGICLAFEPYKYKKDKKLFANYYLRKNNKISVIQLEKVYDYTTATEGQWYRDVKKKGRMWSEPYFGKASNELIAIYGVPIFKKDKDKQELIGVLAAAISLNIIKSLLERLDLGPSGYSSLLSYNGVYLYHPEQEYVLKQKNIAEIAAEKNDDERLYISKAIIRKESGILDHISLTTGKKSWLVYAPVETTGWSVNNTFLQEDIEIDVNVYRQHYIKFATCLLILFLGILLVLSNIEFASVKKLYFLSFVSALLILIAISFLWYVSLKYSNHRKQDSFKVLTRKDLKRYINNLETKSLVYPIYVPMGIYIESMSFKSASVISVYGQIWLKYKINETENLSKELIVSNSTDGGKFKKISVKKENDYEIIHWSFTADINQNFKYITYPLDQENIHIIIKHLDLDNNFFLIPDFDAYKILTPSYCFFIKNNQILKNWEIDKTYFEYRVELSKTNFGLPKFVNSLKDENLTFNIEIRRNYFNIFIARIIPLFVIMILIFSSILFITKDTDTAKFLGMAPAKLISTLAGMFFVLILSHINIRTTLEIDKIFYFEYFYFIMYFFLFYFTINIVVYSLFENIPFIHYKNNLISKLCFWPVLFILVYSVTLFIFY